MRAEFESCSLSLLCLHQVLVPSFLYLSENVRCVFPCARQKIPQVHVEGVRRDLINIPESQKSGCLESRDLDIRFVRFVTSAIVIRLRNGVGMSFQKYIIQQLINARWLNKRRVEQDWMADEKSLDVPLISRADRDIVMVTRGKQELVDICLRIVVERQPDCA
jgi:hypothetical protein